MMDTRSLRCPHRRAELGQAGVAETAGDKAAGRVALLMAQSMWSIWAKESLLDGADDVVNLG
jgi:hypothetical protein